MNIYEKLLQNELFRGLDMIRLRQLLETVSYQYRNYAKNDIIAREGVEVTGIIFLIGGSVRGEMSNHSGKIVKIEDVRGNHVLAPAFIFGANNRYPVHIIANGDTECVFMTRHSLLRLLHADETLLRNFLDMVSARAQFLSEKIRFPSLQNLRGKIALYLLQQSHKDNGPIRLPYSQAKLAELFGVTRPSLTRSLHELEEQGLISIGKQEISILQRAGLEKMVE
jgi:CRP/FNR family transcriptional regulator, dissimilatory nitrate respiration regulator